MHPYNIFKYSLLLFSLSVCLAQAQKTAITYELHGKRFDSISNYPFAKFVGEWTLKNDDWIQNWGGKTDTIKIPKHHTTSKVINTNHTLLSIVDGPEPNGHIFWLYNPKTQTISHLSSFGTIRVGEGTGTMNPNGDVTLKLHFEGEAQGTYRIYKYTWVSPDTYHMKSVQFSATHKATGLFYEGTFVRVK